MIVTPGYDGHGKLLHNPVQFEGIGLCYYRVLMRSETRMTGDFYLSGAILQAYRQPKMFYTPKFFWTIVVPVRHAVQEMAIVPEDVVEVPPL